MIAERIVKLRSMGVLDTFTLNEVLAHYEDRIDEIDQGDILVYLTARAKIEASARAFSLLDDPTRLESMLIESIDKDLKSILSIKDRLDRQLFGDRASQ